MEYVQTPSQGYERQSIEGKAVLVTGGTTGIGRATARLLAANGARVFIFGRHEKELRTALNEMQSISADVYGTIADVAGIEDVRCVFRQMEEVFGTVDILVNNAALGSEHFERQSMETMQYVLLTNVLGYIACAHEAVPRMKKNGGGHIVNIGSMGADLRESDNSVYVATKAAIQGFAESLRKTVNSDGIRVTLIEPGRVATDMVDESQKEKEQKVDDREMLAPEDIARCVYYCLTQPPRCDVVSVQIRPHRQDI